jgi:ATP-binding cassette subfamily B protein
MIRAEPRRFVTNMISYTLFCVCWFMPGWVAQQFFDLLSGKAPAGRSFWTIIAFLLSAQLVKAIGITGTMGNNVPYNFRTQTFLHKNLLRRILELPGAAALPESPGAAIGRLRDDVNELPWFALWCNNIVAYGSYAALALTAMWRVNPLMTVISLAPLILLVAISNLASKRIEQYRESTRQASSRVTSFIAESFGAVQAIQVARAEGKIVAHFAQLNETRRHAALIDRLFNELLNSLYVQSGNLSTSVILFVAVFVIQQQQFTVGDFSLFAYQMAVLAEVVAFCGSFWARYKQTGVSVRRLEALLAGAPSARMIEPGPTWQDGLLPTISAPIPTAADQLEDLQVTGLTYCHPGAERGIFDINLTLCRGSFTVITGRIGSGKTTLVRTLLGLLPRQAGSILWNGLPVTNAGDFFIPPRCAYTAQVPRLFSTTLRENLLLGLPEAAVDLQAAIRLAVLEKDVADLENGLETLVGPKGVKLSGGQIQRTAAARMFVRSAQSAGLLVFDDLSSALDVETEQQLWQQLFALPQRPTCLVVSHRRTALRQADQILVLQEGRVVDQGKLEELLSRCPEMQAIWAGEPGG